MACLVAIELFLRLANQDDDDDGSDGCLLYTSDAADE